MRKLLFLLATIVLYASAVSQPVKKTRHTASNTQEAVTERAISRRFNQGLRNYYTAQYEDALQAFSGILTDAPKHAPSYFMLSRVYAEQQLFTEAEYALKQAVKYDKNNLWYQVELARSYVRDENYKAATPMWEKICKEIPDNPEYLNFLLVCYAKSDAPDKAAEVQSRLAVLTRQGDEDEQPSDTPEGNSNGESHKAQGAAALKAQRYEQAVSFFETALHEDDTDYDLWELFAEAVSKSRQWHKLTAMEDDLTTLFPQSSLLLSALADAFFHDGHPETAVEYYKQALAFAYDSDLIRTIRQGLHAAYTQMGDAENAAKYR